MQQNFEYFLINNVRENENFFNLYFRYLFYMHKKKTQIVYRFISKNNEFVESHTGLEDTLIEKGEISEATATKDRMPQKI